MLATRSRSAIVVDIVDTKQVYGSNRKIWVSKEVGDSRSATKAQSVDGVSVLTNIHSDSR